LSEAVLTITLLFHATVLTFILLLFCATFHEILAVDDDEL